MFTSEFDYFDWLSQFDSEWRETPKLVNFAMYTIKVKIWQWLKLLNSFPFIKKTLVNHLYIWIWSFWLTFTALHWMKTNFKISQFPRFLLRSGDAIFVKFWKWLNLLNSAPFTKKTLVNHVSIGIWSSWLIFPVLQWMKKNSKISQFSPSVSCWSILWVLQDVTALISSFLLRSWYAILVKIWKWLKLLNSFPFIKKTLVNQVYIQIWSFWLTFTVSQWMKKNSKFSQFPSFLLRFGYAI